MQYLQPKRTRFAGWLDWFSRLSAIMGHGAFSRLSDQALADHHWASESALLRALRNGNVEQVKTLTPLIAAMEREMRRRMIIR